MNLGGGKRAVYRSRDGELSVLSPVCLKCHVSWNPAESTWDCPCHGSRFNTDGGVIEGPALQPLERRQLDPTSTAAHVVSASDDYQRPAAH